MDDVLASYSALCTKCKELFSVYICIQIPQTHSQFSMQNWSNASRKGAEAGKQANTSSSPFAYCSTTQSLAYAGLPSNPLYTPSGVERRGRAVLLDAGWLAM